MHHLALQGEASVGAVHKLPLEIFRSEEELRAMHAGELKQLLMCAALRCPWELLHCPPLSSPKLASGAKRVCFARPHDGALMLLILPRRREARMLAERGAQQPKQQPAAAVRGRARPQTASSSYSPGAGASPGWGGAGARAPLPLERGEIIRELLELRGGARVTPGGDALLCCPSCFFRLPCAF